ncbi:hypothetical protein NDU88_003616 [Pleurodeles waltl]|uniref:Uncharacterized protein n=1 Tax=Pleurodeles waltl TaxID=8319 RepID=A0AAV7LJ32_PLEWA|nr:hypothetical protein NDU88_003616 [Pleurodeles waltl]
MIGEHEKDALTKRRHSCARPRKHEEHLRGRQTVLLEPRAPLQPTGCVFIEGWGPGSLPLPDPHPHVPARRRCHKRAPLIGVAPCRNPVNHAAMWVLAVT